MPSLSAGLTCEGVVVLVTGEGEGGVWPLAWYPASVPPVNVRHSQTSGRPATVSRHTKYFQISHRRSPTPTPTLPTPTPTLPTPTPTLPTPTPTLPTPTLPIPTLPSTQHQQWALSVIVIFRWNNEMNPCCQFSDVWLEGDVICMFYKGTADCWAVEFECMVGFSVLV